MDNKEQLFKFLTYSYFRIVPENLFPEIENEDSYRDHCIKKVIITAYKDATNQGAYNTLFSKKLDNRETLLNESDTAQNNSSKYLFERIKELIKNPEQNKFEDWHNNTCKQIVKNYKNVKRNEESFFTYGNAQKWVNMTMKYLWMLGLLPDGIDEDKLHIPLDSFIIDVLKENEKVTLPFTGDNQKSSKKVRGWSQWTKKDYEDFRESISGTKKYTLKWENDVWIKQAENRKKKDIKKQEEKFFKE